jgi:hypothetical protein
MLARTPIEIELGKSYLLRWIWLSESYGKLIDT